MNRTDTNSATTKGVEATPPQGQAMLILERIRDGFFAVDREWRITYINNSAISAAIPSEARIR